MHDALYTLSLPQPTTEMMIMMTQFVFHGFRPVLMGFHGSRLVFHGSRLAFHGSRSVFVVFHGSRPVFMDFHGSRLVVHVFSRKCTRPICILALRSSLGPPPGGRHRT